MNVRKKALGAKNIIGARVTLARQQKHMLQKDLLAQLHIHEVEIRACSIIPKDSVISTKS